MIFQIQGCKLQGFCRKLPRDAQNLVRVSFVPRCPYVCKWLIRMPLCQLESGEHHRRIWVLWMLHTLHLKAASPIRWICASFLAFSCIDMEIIEVVFESPVGSATTTWRGWPVITSLQQVFLMPMRSWKIEIAASMKQSELEEVWKFDAVDIKRYNICNIM